MLHRWIRAKRNVKIFFEAVAALRLSLGLVVCSQVEDLIQEHIHPPQRLLRPPFTD